VVKVVTVSINMVDDDVAIIRNKAIEEQMFKD